MAVLPILRTENVEGSTLPSAPGAGLSAWVMAGGGAGGCLGGLALLVLLAELVELGGDTG